MLAKLLLLRACLVLPIHTQHQALLFAHLLVRVVRIFPLALHALFALEEPTFLLLGFKHLAHLV